MTGTRMRRARRVERPTALWWLSAVVVLIGGAGFAFRAGAPVAPLTVAVLIGLVLAAAAVLLPRFGGAATAVVGFGGMLLLARAESVALYVWPGAVGLGATLATAAVWRRQQARRPPGAAAALLRTVHDDGGDLVEQVDPSGAQVRELVERLDGRSRTGVSVLRRPARLDVGGDAGGALLVALCEDTTARRPVWSVVGSSLPSWRADEVAVRVAGVDAHLPATSLTTLPAALAALDGFLASGRAIGTLPWRTGTDVEDLRAVFDGLDL